MIQPTPREWARSQGYTVGDRGRIDRSIMDEYRAAFGNGPAPKKITNNNSRKDINDVRAWAIENGIPVSERGRVSAKVKADYDKAKRKITLASVDPKILEMAQKLAAQRLASNSVVIKSGYKTQFCCWPLEDQYVKHHRNCPGTIMNATLVGGVRKNVRCTCDCHAQ